MPLRTLAAICMLVVTVCFATGCATHQPQQHRAGSRSGGGAADATRGKAIYARDCSACHGTRGVGGPIGPSLHLESSRRTFEAIDAIVRDPQPPMPKTYPAQLSRADVRDVTAYVETL